MKTFTEYLLGSKSIWLTILIPLVAMPIFGTHLYRNEYPNAGLVLFALTPVAIIFAILAHHNNYKNKKLKNKL